MKIAIIDSGIETRHRKLRDARIRGVGFEWRNGTVYGPTEDFEDQLGHGTAVAAIIHNHLPDAELIGVRIFGRELACAEKVMNAALQWCIEQQVDVVNMSVGISASTPSEELSAICRQAREKKIMIVAAAPNEKGETGYPASFPYVFGVGCGTVSRKKEYGFDGSSPIEFVAKGSIQRVATIGDSYKIEQGTSYAAAHFTGILAGIRQEMPEAGFTELREALAERAVPGVTGISVHPGDLSLKIVNDDAGRRVSSYLDKTENRKGLGRLALYPVSEKEMALFDTFPEGCICPITLRIDYPRTSRRGTDDSQEKVIYRFPTEAEFDSFDTMVVGYFHDNLFQANVRFGFRLIEKAIDRGKHFFVFDHELKARIDELIQQHGSSQSRAYVPVVDRNTEAAMAHYQYYPEIKTPVLCVCGTTNKQGKFTTQLRVKELLEKNGYGVSFISTEPHGELFGACFSFPFGHKDTVFLDYRRWPFFLRALTKAVEQYHAPDIIVSGTQSWGIPPSLSMHPLGGELDAMQYIFGVQPDAVICAINPNDSLQLIERTLAGINLFSAARVLFFVMTPWQREFRQGNSGSGMLSTQKLQPDEFRERMEYYSRELKTPVIDVMDPENDAFILQAIENFYS